MNHESQDREEFDRAQIRELARLIGQDILHHPWQSPEEIVLFYLEKFLEGVLP